MSSVGVVPRAMSALVVGRFGGAADAMHWRSGETVPAPAAHQILMRVRYAGVNPVDTYIRSGSYPRLPQLPYVPGGDAAGTVLAVGTAVPHDKFQVGDLAACAASPSGSYAQYCLADVDKAWRFRPNDVYTTDEEVLQAAAAIGVPYCTAWRALFTRCGARAGATLLVHGGSGAVGLAACQLAADCGLRVLATAGSQAGAQLCRRHGAHAVFNHRRAGYDDGIKEAAGPDGVDIVLEMLANVNLPVDMQLLAPNGTIAVVGSRGRVEIDPRQLMLREGSVVGVALATTTKAEWLQMARSIDGLWRRGVIRPPIDKVFDARRAADAHDYITSSDRASAGKVLLHVPHM